MPADRLLYQRLLNIPRASIVDERLAAGAVLPTECPITARQALRDLEREGLIRKRADYPSRAYHTREDGREFRKYHPE